MVSMLISGGTLITMDPQRRVIENGAVAIDGDMILEVGKTKDLQKRHDTDTTLDARHKVVMPGIIDGHGHAGHGLVKTLGLHSDTWGEACEIIYSQASTEEFWKVDALLTSLERLKFGTTCSVTYMGGGDSVMRVDHPAYARSHCKAVEKVGVREFLAVGPRKPPFPRKYSRWEGELRRDYMVSFEEQLETCKSVIEEWHGKADGRIKISLMFPVPRPEKKTVSQQEFKELKSQASSIRNLSREHGLIFTMDGHSRGTVKFCHVELDLLGPDALFSHSTDLTLEEIKLCQETNTRIVHNPSAIASIIGRCPVPELLEAGVTVMLGSDAPAPDRSYDMFRHMFQCMRYQRRHYRDSRVLPPGKILEMVTIDSARALGLENEIGSLEPGKKADIIILDVFKPHIYPFNLPVDRVTYFANGNDVDTVIVDGRILMEKRKVNTVNEASVLENAQHEIEVAIERSGLSSLKETPDSYWGHSRY